MVLDVDESVDVEVDLDFRHWGPTECSAQSIRSAEGGDHLQVQVQVEVHVFVEVQARQSVLLSSR